MIPPNNPDDADFTPSSQPDPKFLTENARVTMAALRERVELQFSAETAARADIIRDLDEAGRHDLIRELVDYVLTVEAITLSRGERLIVLNTLYKDLFSLGPLDPYLSDETITEIKIDGPDKVYLRHGSGDLTPKETHFDDQLHMERVIERTLAMAGAELSEREPLLEVGVTFAERPARLTVALPPVSPTMHASLRLHPKKALILADLVAAERLDESASRLLRTILRAGYGLMIVGDAGAGKTTLLQSLLSSVSDNSVVVERASELQIPDQISRLTVIPPAEGQDPVAYSEQIVKALDILHKQSDSERGWLVLDEVRFDESAAMWQALTADHAPRCLWTFRGGIDPLRLRTAFGMSVRRAQQGIEQASIYSALLERLPFVVRLVRREGKLKVIGIAEWQSTDSEDIALRPLWPAEGISPAHAVDWKP